MTLGQSWLLADTNTIPGKDPKHDNFQGEQGGEYWREEELEQPLDPPRELTFQNVCIFTNLRGFGHTQVRDHRVLRSFVNTYVRDHFIL